LKLRPSNIRGGWSVVIALIVFVCGFGLYKISTAPDPATIQPKAFISTQSAATATPAPSLPQTQPTETPTTSRPSRPPAPLVEESEVVPDLAAADDDEETAVYVTRTGKKYHRTGCRYLSRSMIPISLEDAQAEYDPCSVCDPPE
jgi:competence protein ComEC